MLTQVTFTTQNDLKQQALAKAKREGFPLKTVMIYALKGFVAGKLTFGLSANEADVEEIYFKNAKLSNKAKKLSKLLE